LYYDPLRFSPCCLDLGAKKKEKKKKRMFSFHGAKNEKHCFFLFLFF